MIAFFIDADNLCAPSWVDEACGLLEESEGSISLRRAYGSTEKLKGLADVLRTRLIRPFVNLALSKNTTDVALAIDAMETSYANPRPTVIAIGSGDADFVPLVLRLRERGFRVVCLSQKGKMAPEAMGAYDKVMFVGDGDVVFAGQVPAAAPHKEEPVAVAVAKPQSREVTQAPKAPAKKAAAKKTTTAVKSTGAMPAKAAAKKAPAKKASAAAKKNTTNTGAVKAAPGAMAAPVSVASILQHAPSLKSGQAQPLGEIAKLLHDAKLLGKNAASTKLFKKFPQQFDLSPARQPNKVRYIPPTH